MSDPKAIIQTADLGQGWFANLKRDGSMTVRNCDQGRRFDLDAGQVNILRQAFAEAEKVSPRY